MLSFSPYLQRVLAFGALALVFGVSTTVAGMPQPSCAAPYPLLTPAASCFQPPAPGDSHSPSPVNLDKNRDGIEDTFQNKQLPKETLKAKDLLDDLTPNKIKMAVKPKEAGE